MRPVNKGESPYITISDYAEALPYLVDRIGAYCSYCGFPIDHVPEVEHISAKSEGGDKTAWTNLLLACKYCNTRKSKIVSPINQGEYLWPDTDNTALAYSYDGGIPRVNEEAIRRADSTGKMLEKAEKLYSLLKLNNVPKPGDKDRRFMKRSEVYDIACRSLQGWKDIKEKDDSLAKVFFAQTIVLARQSGFFPVWTEVFRDEPEALRAFIAAFPGTERTFFDDSGRPNSVICRNKETCQNRHES